MDLSFLSSWSAFASARLVRKRSSQRDFAIRFLDVSSHTQISRMVAPAALAALACATRYRLATLSILRPAMCHVRGGEWEENSSRSDRLIDESIPRKATFMNITNASADVLKGLGGMLSDLEAVYKDLHAHPELSMQETRTARVASDRLRAAGYEVTTGVGNTGVVGLLRNGEGRTVMLRADMDALPVQEATGLPYASKVTATDSTGRTTPVMHACGHDMHVTWLIGAAVLFANARHAWKGTLMTVFQPAEETAAGAQAMIGV
jgi:hypothetical protein